MVSLLKQDAEIQLQKHEVRVLPFHIGKTPVIQLSQRFSKTNNIYLKLESHNPTGSVKDRAVYAMMEPYLKTGKEESLHFILPSSGNAGISLAYLCSVFQQKCTIFASPDIAPIKIALIKHFGGNVITCDGDVSTEPGGWVYESNRFHEKTTSSILLNQFNNEQNVCVHEQTTAPELENHMIEKEIVLDYLFVGVGSGGTAQGILNFYKKHQKSTRVIGVEPVGGLLHGYYHEYESVYVDHGVEALSDCFVPENLNPTYRFDDVIQYTDQQMRTMQKRLETEEGVLVGEATGFMTSAIQDYIEKYDLKGKNIALIATDDAFRYIDGVRHG
ncbi:pyridoxal-phosphate dependent enzyme [Exiguobacterium acetylicum]|uniref:Pyridoxal-phosphate dependent enzyme n=2 Tax=Exiguobacterium TaxID=33986 RepID=A0ABX8GDS7_EXIAC|nr:pyridoxal-phosphate dependent enzyme [Exiguobacterium acetylicum]QWB31810.1 pyridoxal-phosphate dependent enzyme [Exiguobacterium acetylicum]